MSSIPLPLSPQTSLLFSPPNTSPTLPQPHTTPIAHFHSQPPPIPYGSLIAISTSYIVYAVKNGLVRVIDRKKALRMLLRGHESRVTDVRFFRDERDERRQGGGVGGGSHVLGTVGGGKVLIWRLFGGGGSDANSTGDVPMGSETLLEVRLPSAGRLVWHPTDPNRFLLLHHFEGKEKRPRVTIVETTRLRTVVEKEGGHAVCPEGGWDKGCVIYSEETVSDACWEERGGRVVTCEEGKVKLWEVREGGVMCVSSVEVGGVERCLFLEGFGGVEGENPIEPMEGWRTAPFVTTGGEGREVSIWSPFGEGGSPKKMKEFVFGGEEKGLKMAMALVHIRTTITSSKTLPSPPSAYLLFADMTAGNLYALHLTSQYDNNNNTPQQSLPLIKGFDYVTPFNVVQPILSWSIMCGETSLSEVVTDTSDKHSGFEICLFCVQSKAVQLLKLKPNMFPTPQQLDAMQSEGRHASVTVRDLPKAATVTTEDGNGKSASVTPPPPADVTPDHKSTYSEEDYEMDDTDYDSQNHYDYESSVADDNDDDSDNDDDFDNANRHSSSLPSPPPATMLPPPGLGQSTPAPNNNGTAAATPFANWLGAIAVKTTTTAPSKSLPTKTPPNSRNSSNLQDEVPEGDERGGRMSPPVIVNSETSKEIKAPPPPPPPPQTFLSPMEFLKKTVPPPVGSEGVVKKEEEEEVKKKKKSGGSSKERSSQSKPESQTSTRQHHHTPSPPPPSNSTHPKKSKSSSTTTKSKSKTTPLTPPHGKVTLLKRPDQQPPIPPPPLPPTTRPPPTTSTNSELDTLLKTTLQSHSQTLLTSLQSQIQSSLTTTILPTLTKTLKKDLHETLSQPLLSNLSTLSHTISSTTRDLSSNMSQQYHAHRTATDNAMMQKLSKESVDAFHSTMTRVMIPAFEAATQQLFSQVGGVLEEKLSKDDLFRKEKEEKVENLEKEVEGLRRSVEALAGEMKGLKTAVEESTAAILAAVAKNEDGGGKPPPPAPSPPTPVVDVHQSTKTNILNLLRTNDYERAFTEALSASSADIAVFCCRHANITAVLGLDDDDDETTPTLSQPLLLCLMQQLGSVLVTAKDEELGVVLEWLRDIGVSLHPEDESIRRYVNGVLTQLVENVNEKMSREGGGGNRQLKRSLQMLLQVIRGMGMV